MKYKGLIKLDNNNKYEYYSISNNYLKLNQFLGFIGFYFS